LDQLLAKKEQKQERKAETWLIGLLLSQRRKGEDRKERLPVAIDYWIDQSKQKNASCNEKNDLSAKGKLKKITSFSSFLQLR